MSPGSLLALGRDETDYLTTEDGGGTCRRICQELAEAIRRDGLDVLYVIGDREAIRLADGVAEVLRLQNVLGRKTAKVVRVVCAPVSIHNDILFTDATLGFRTSVESAVDYIKRAHCWAESSGQLAIVELPDAESGFLALHALTQAARLMACSSRRCSAPTVPWQTVSWNVRSAS